MSNELRITSTPGNVIYGPVVNDAGLFWNPNASTPAFEAYGTGGNDHTVYAISANETPSSGTSGLFLGNFPTTIPAGVYWWLPRVQLSGVSGSPADTDPWAGPPQKINWTGSAEAFPLASSSAGAIAVAMSGANVNANLVQIATQTAVASGGVIFPGSIGTSTLTQSQVTGGAYALNTDGSGNVKISSGTGANQINLSGGVANANVVQIVGTASAGAAGYVGTDHSKITNPTATVGLANTTISSAQAIASVTGAVGSVSGSLTGTIGGFAAGLLDANGWLKVDLVGIAGTAVNSASAQLGVNVVNIAGAASAGAAGYVGVDHSKTTNPTATVALSNTTLSNQQQVLSVTNAVSLPTGTGTGQINLSGGAVSLQPAQVVYPDWSHVLNSTSTVALSNTTINTSGGGNVNVTAWNGTAVSLSGGLPNVHDANFLGSGPIAIDQDTGGTDNLRYVDVSGNGVEGASVLIYLATDWPVQPDQVQAAAVTGPDGRWLAPAFVASGTYVAVFTKIGADGPDVSSAFSV